MRLADEHANAEYYSFSTDPRFGVADFTDGHHLNSSGARKLTQFLDEEMVKGIAS